MESNEFDVLGDKIRVLITRKQTGGAFDVIEFTAPESSGPPPHSHAWLESTYVVDGEVEFSMNGKTTLVSAGGLFTTTPNTVHTYRVVSKQARFVLFAAPSAVYEFLAEVAREVKHVPEDLPKILTISSKHGVSVAPAPA